VLGLFALAFARPLLEEWGVVLSWRQLGTWHYWDQAQVHILRPLESIPAWFYSLLGGGRLYGFAVGFGILLLIKYAAGRWAVATVLSRPGQWIVGSLSAVLVAWPGAWRLRFSPAQLSLAFFLLALGATLRNRDAFRWKWAVLAGVGTALMLATYQALLICAVVLPLVALLATTEPLPPTRREVLRALVRTAGPIVAGIAAYAIYALIAKSTGDGQQYEETLYSSGDALNSISGVRSAISDLYRTAYVNSTLTLPLLAGFAALLARPALTEAAGHRAVARRLAGVFVAVAALPLLSGVYAFASAHRVDPDRVLFPVAVGFVLLSVVLLARYRTRPGAALTWPWAGAIVAVLLFSSGVDGVVRHRDYAAENSVIGAVTRVAEEQHPSSVVVRDYSGTLGDVYRLYPPTLSQAVAVRGATVDATICTAAGVARYQPEARLLHVEVTPSCADLDVEGKPVVLDAHSAPDGWTVTVADTRDPAK